jgi:hypothetical protein
VVKKHLAFSSIFSRNSCHALPPFRPQTYALPNSRRDLTLPAASCVAYMVRWKLPTDMCPYAPEVCQLTLLS